MAWLKYLMPLLHVLASVMGFLTRRRDKRIGRLEAEHAQAEQDLRTLRKTSDARRAVRHDPDRLRNDPYNRDAG